MNAVRSTNTVTEIAAARAAAISVREPEKPAAARLVDDLAVPTPSPVHRLQAGLAQLAAPAEVAAEEPYPGWIRMIFPVATSILLWAGILRGAALLLAPVSFH